MTATNKLGLELLQNAAANQTLANTTFALLNQLVQAGVVDKDLAAPPSSPADESLYIVGASATGAWAGRDGQLAYWLITAGAWQFIAPKEGFFLHVNDEDVFYKFTGTAWEVFSGGGGGGMTNPMTSIRDLIVGGVGGAPTRLAGPTSEGMVLTRIGNALAWAIATGFANPMTTGGDIIIGGTNGAATRLGAGTAGQVLTMVAGAPAWVTPSGGGGGMTNPMTASGDLIVGGNGGSPQRLGVGGAGQVLTVTSAGALVWATPSSGGGTGDFKSDGSVPMTGGIKYNSAIVTIPISGGEANIYATASEICRITDSGNVLISFAGGTPSTIRRVIFSSNITIQNGSGSAAHIECMTGADIVTKSGDIATFVCLSPFIWKMIAYEKYDGTPLVSSAGFTEAQVRATPLTGLPATTGDVTETDSVISGIGKLQASKVAKESGKGLSTNDYTTTEKNKLASIAEGAQVNSVTSVAGRTGAVTLAKGDVGLGNADNTADSAKPVSTPQQTALNLKANRTDPSFDGSTTTFATEVVRHDPAAGINAGYEIGSTKGQATTPYMDFHSGATATDYDVRFLFSGGNGSSGNGNMTFMGAMLTLAGRLACNFPLRPAQYTLSTLPSASAFDGYEIDVTNATGGPKRCRSNGSAWQILNTTTTVS